ncbi:MAG: hypothetical protein BGP11_13135 [Rhodobacterales bacterium 65-51]|nr:MAG: hypothetical protein BGP11_13135 [Rhodobacterales bacterium 65-51]
MQILAAIGVTRVVIRVAAEVRRIDGLRRGTKIEMESMPFENGDVIESRDEGSHLVDAARSGNILAFDRDARATEGLPADQPQFGPDLVRNDSEIKLVGRATPALKLHAIPNLPDLGAS